MLNNAEIEKFTQLANEWWDPEGSFKLLHEINPLRLQYILNAIDKNFKSSNRYIADLSILDIGCGGGLISLPLSRLGGKVTALDAGAENVNIAKAQAKLENLEIEFFIGISSTLVSEAKSYDVITCLEVIEHVDDQESLISDVSSLLKPNGIAILSTINRTLKAKLLTIALAEYVLKWVPKGTHDCEKYLTPAEIRKIAAGYSLKTLELKGLEFNLLNRTWFLSEQLDVNYFIILQKL